MTEEEKSIKSMKEFAYTTYGVLTVEEAKTVLNLIQKQQEQIKELKQSLEIDDILLKREAELSEELKAEIKKKDKYTKDLCENYCPKKTKLEKKDKMIYLMAKEIKEDGLRVGDKCYHDREFCDRYERCEECIIEHFKKKAEKN